MELSPAATPNGPRVITLNIHKSIPGRLDLRNENETLAVLDDIAAQIRDLNADVILLQEVDVDRDGKNDGVSEQLAELMSRLGTDQAAYAPTLSTKPNDPQHADEYGIAVITRNGYTIGDSHNIDLPNPHQGKGAGHDRNAQVVSVIAPDGKQMTVLNTHLDNVSGEQSSRADQLLAIGKLAHDIRESGAFTYYHALAGSGDGEGREHAASGLPQALVIGGDFNTDRYAVAYALASAGSNAVNVANGSHLIDRASHTGGNRIDHMFVDGLTAQAPIFEWTPSNQTRQYLLQRYSQPTTLKERLTFAAQRVALRLGFLNEPTDHAAVGATLLLGNT